MTNYNRISLGEAGHLWGMLAANRWLIITRATYWRSGFIQGANGQANVDLLVQEAVFRRALKPTSLAA